MVEDFRISVLQRNPEYEKILKAHNELFGTDEINVISEQNWYNKIYEPVAEKTGLPVENVRRAYNWLICPHVGIIKKKNRKSLGGDLGDDVRLPEENLNYLKIIS